MTIGIAIPTYIGHIKFLERLLDSIEDSTVLPDQVVISASELKEKLFIKDKYSFNITVLSPEGYRNPAQNTNIALERLDTDIMTVIGGDDMVHPQRNEFILQAFENKKIDIVVHNHLQATEVDREFLSSHYDSVYLYIDYINTIVPNRIYPISNKQHFNYGNPFISFRRFIFDRFKYDESEEAVYIEDSLFNRALVNSGYKISYIKQRLVLYLKNPYRKP